VRVSRHRQKCADRKPAGRLAFLAFCRGGAGFIGPGPMPTFTAACSSCVHPPLIIPSSAIRPPQGEVCVHEPKLDGYRFQVVKPAARCCCIRAAAAENSDRLPGVAEAVKAVPARAVVLDAELVLLNADGAANFR
jgi:ATP-dependent DNA ligase